MPTGAKRICSGGPANYDGHHGDVEGWAGVRAAGASGCIHRAHDLTAVVRTPGEQLAAGAPKERPAFADPRDSVAPLGSLIPPIEAPRDPAEPFNVVTTALTSAESAWGAVHWARPSGPVAGSWAPAAPSDLHASPGPPPNEPLIPAAGPVPTTNGFPAPGTPAWFTPPERLPQPVPSTPVTAKNVLDAITPGVYISLAIGGFVYLLAPSCSASRSRSPAGWRLPRTTGVAPSPMAFFVVGFLAVVGVLNIPASFGDWWSFVGVWSLIICWLVLIALALIVRAELDRRAAGRPLLRHHGADEEFGPRTLTEALRAFDLDQLTTLLDQREDLGEPVPHDLTELASRATTTSSLARVLEHLNAFQRVATGRPGGAA